MSKKRNFSKKSLLKKKKSSPGRTRGTITVRHKQLGSRKKIRVVDYKITDISDGVVKEVSYDPNRNVDLALVVDKVTGQYHYILRPAGLNVGDPIYFNKSNAFKPGNRFHLKDIPVGTSIHNIELESGRGGVIARSAGTSASILGFDGDYAIVKLPSKQTRLIHSNCTASIGVLGNENFRNRKIGKAGKSRYLGRRPTVRGMAMNAVDHNNGGGEGKGVIGHPSTDVWGNVRGKKTRRKKNKFNRFILVTRKGEKVV